MICPECRRELGNSTSVDMTQDGWCCSKCGIKIYRDKKR